MGAKPVRGATGANPTRGAYLLRSLSTLGFYLSREILRILVSFVFDLERQVRRYEPFWFMGAKPVRGATGANPTRGAYLLRSLRTL